MRIADIETTSRARELRACSTSAEARLWTRLRDRRFDEGAAALEGRATLSLRERVGAEGDGVRGCGLSRLQQPFLPPRNPSSDRCAATFPLWEKERS